MRTHSLRSLNIFEWVRWYPSSGSLMPGRVAQSVGHLTRKSQGLGFDTLSGHILSFLLPLKRGSCQLLAKVCARSTG